MTRGAREMVDYAQVMMDAEGYLTPDDCQELVVRTPSVASISSDRRASREEIREAEDVEERRPLGPLGPLRCHVLFSSPPLGQGLSGRSWERQSFSRCNMM